MRLSNLLIIALAPFTAQAANLNQSFNDRVYVNYFSGQTAAKSSRAGILILPEWWGLSDFEKQTADRLAKAGYAVLAVDLYGGGKTSFDPEVASAMMRESERPDHRLNDRVEAARKQLLSRPGVDSKRVAIIGFGFGGGLSLDQARLGLPYKAAISFYGGVQNSARVYDKPIVGELLEIVGSRDQFVPPHQLEEFRREMRGAHARFDVVVIPGAYQSFANKLADAAGTKYRKPFQYDARAAATAWAKAEALLARSLASSTK